MEIVLKNTRLRVLSIVILCGCLCVPATVNAEKIIFGDVMDTPVAVGEVISVPVKIDGSLKRDKKIITLSIAYDRSTLWMKSFTPSKGWAQSLGRAETLQDRERGIYRTVLGSTENLESVFGYFEFIAVKSGTTSVSIDDRTRIYDGAMNNIGDGGDVLAGFIKDSVSEAGATQLFDIRASISPEIVKKGTTPELRVSFESFGSVPTPVDMTIRVVNDEGIEVFREEDSVIVETSREYKLPLLLPDYKKGYYTVWVQTVYGNNVRDAFRSSFTVRTPPEEKIVYGGILAMFLVGCGVVAIDMVRMRRKNNMHAEPLAEQA